MPTTTPPILQSNAPHLAGSPWLLGETNRTPASATSADDHSVPDDAVTVGRMSLGSIVYEPGLRLGDLPVHERAALRQVLEATPGIWTVPDDEREDGRGRTPRAGSGSPKESRLEVVTTRESSALCARESGDLNGSGDGPGCVR
jgi:hypothetical protein